MLMDAVPKIVSHTQKVCSKCGQEKPLDDFSRAKNRPEGRHDWCKGCLYPTLKKSYHDRRNVVALAKDCPCADCGRTFPSWVMQFDHLRDKSFRLGTVQRGIESIRKEIEKCEVVCANCHAHRTYCRMKGIQHYRLGE